MIFFLCNDTQPSWVSTCPSINQKYFHCIWKRNNLILFLPVYIIFLFVMFSFHNKHQETEGHRYSECQVSELFPPDSPFKMLCLFPGHPFMVSLSETCVSPQNTDSHADFSRDSCFMYFSTFSLPYNGIIDIQ